MTDYPHPVFYANDTAKSLRVTVRDKNGVVADLSGGGYTPKLFAKCIETGDQPGSGSGVTGTFPNGGGDGVIDFAALGNACSLTAGRGAQLYYYNVRITGPSVSYSDEGHFILKGHV